VCCRHDSTSFCRGLAQITTDEAHWSRNQEFDSCESAKIGGGEFCLSERIKLVECPRDAWQGLPGMIPADLKADYLRALISTGFKHIDAASFVSPKAVPQMADSEQVLKELDPPDDVEIIGIVVNEKGAQRAIDTQAISTLGFPYSISETFLRKNQNQSAEEALDELEKIQKKADAASLDVVVYISMAFGNPYGDPWSADEVVEAIALLEVENLQMISLADTVGMATPQQISDLVGALMAKYGYLEIGLHLHSRPEQVAEKILAAYDAGCRRFDSALGGLGGCPFAQDALVGNIPTEKVIETLSRRGAELPQLKPLDTLLRATGGIAARYSDSQAAD
jgi:hydroxymethylglutaryl-CoA lyase